MSRCRPANAMQLILPSLTAPSRTATIYVLKMCAISCSSSSERESEGMLLEIRTSLLLKLSVKSSVTMPCSSFLSARCFLVSLSKDVSIARSVHGSDVTDKRGKFSALERPLVVQNRSHACGCASHNQGQDCTFDCTSTVDHHPMGRIFEGDLHYFSIKTA